MNNKFNSEKYYASLKRNVMEVKEVTDFVPDVAVILGTGLNEFASSINVVAEVPFKSLSDFPLPTNPNHQGKLIFGTARGANLVCLKGRVHYYEGYAAKDVVKPIRLSKMLGAKTLIITNAVGAINPFYHAGDFVSIYDHISLFTPSPLLGPNIAQLGDDFVDMTHIYDAEINHVLYEIARDNDIVLRSGIHVQSTGRQYESPAETKMLHSMGADVVGMSSTTEAIAARHMGMRISQLSFVSNMAGGLQESINDDEVKLMASKCNSQFAILLNGILDFLKAEKKLKSKLSEFSR